MVRAYERYWVDDKGIVVGQQGPPHAMPVGIGPLDTIMESYFVLHRAKYASAGPGRDQVSDEPSAAP